MADENANDCICGMGWAPEEGCPVHGGSVSAKPSIISDQRVYLIVRGEVEVGPGRFVPGVVSSTHHESVEAAKSYWADRVREGLWEEPFESYEIQTEGPTVSEALAEPAGEDRDAATLALVRAILAPPRVYTGWAWGGEDFADRNLISVPLTPKEACAGGRYAPGFYATHELGDGGEVYVEFEGLLAWAGLPSVGLADDPAVVELRKLAEPAGEAGER